MSGDAHNPLSPGYYHSEELRTFGFRAVAENVQISRDCLVIGPGNVSLGFGVRIDSGTAIIATGGQLVFEGWNHIGGQCHLSVGADLTIGEFAGLSQGVRIYTATDDYSGRHMTNPCVPAELRHCKIAPITIGRHAIVGSGAIILPGCHLGDGVAVGALSLVTKPLEPWGVYHGNPARLMKSRFRDVLELEKRVPRD